MALDKNPSFAILGCGPIGGIFATHIAQAAGKIALIDANKTHLNRIRDRGLEVIINNESKTVNFDHVYSSLNEMTDIGFDYLVIALKSPVMEGLVPSIAASIPETTCVISLQNGIGTEDFLARYFGCERVFRMVVNYAGSLVGPGTIRETFFHPPNYLGALEEESCPDARALADFISDAGLATEFTPDIERYEWQKSAMNIALSSVSAITGLNMRDAMALLHTRQLVTAILKEIIHVSQIKGIALGDDYLEKSLKYMDSAGPHMPSMRTDIENKRATEINFLNQKVIEVAHTANISTPFLESVTSLIRGLEHSFGGIYGDCR